MNQLECYELVNKAETIEALANAILEIADKETGMIKGRTNEFNAKQMANALKFCIETHSNYNMLTREYGIRQQAMYLIHYNKFGS